MIEIYADLWCPFAHVGLRAAAQIRDELSPDTALVIHAWPLELINGTPLDTDKTTANIEALRSSVAPELFAGFKSRNFPLSTLQGLALIEAANEIDVHLGERIGLGLRNLLFEHGVKIDNPELLAGIARQNGLSESVIDDVAAVRTRLQEEQSRGVKGSPHFFIGDQSLFCPLLDLSRDESGTLNASADMERLETFLRVGFDNGS